MRPDLVLHAADAAAHLTGGGGSPGVFLGLLGVAVAGGGAAAWWIARRR